MAEVVALTLANICLDVQIGICMFLHPSDILALRKTCRALQPTTRQRVVWVAALHRVCLDNTLFLPSFPISDMSDLELEKAAMAPRRWIELCGAFEKQHLINDRDAILRPRTTRTIADPLPTEVDWHWHAAEYFIVPGGRYVVSSLYNGISVLDLGYTSSADCKLMASVVPEGWGKPGRSSICKIQATPEGMGLTIFSAVLTKNCSVYEIYPQSEMPHLSQIAHLDFDLSKHFRAYLLPGTVIMYEFYVDRIVYRVWDYRLNHSISFTVDKFERYIGDTATKTAVIVLSGEVISIYAIPPLLPQPPDFNDHNPTHIPPLFTIPFPDGTALYPEIIEWKTTSSWYFGSSHPFYFDLLCQDSKLQRFKLIVKPDLSDASLHVINTSELTPHDFNFVFFQFYGICEDTLVSFWMDHEYQCGIYTGLTSTRFANVISHGGPAAKMLLPDTGPDSPHEYCLYSSCPASGRFILQRDERVVVLDFF